MTAMDIDKSHEKFLAEVAAELRTKTDKKRYAQAMLMHGIGNVLGYWTENDPAADVLTEAERLEFGKILIHEADRVAKMFGFDRAWSN